MRRRGLGAFDARVRQMWPAVLFASAQTGRFPDFDFQPSYMPCLRARTMRATGKVSMAGRQ
jgi:hypothetical protein